MLQPTTLSLCGLCTAAVRTADKFFVAIYRFQFILSQKNSHTSTGSQTHNPDSPTPYTTMHQLYQLYNAQIGAPPCHRTNKGHTQRLSANCFFIKKWQYCCSECSVLQPTTLSLCSLCTAAVRTADKLFVAIYRFRFIILTILELNSQFSNSFIWQSCQEW